MGTIRYPETAIEKLGDTISRAGILASPDKRWHEMGSVAVSYAEIQCAPLRAEIVELKAEIERLKWQGGAG